MTRPSFIEGVAVAVLAAVGGSLAFAALRLLLPADVAACLLVAGLAFAYSVYLLLRSAERVGRLTVLLSWAGLGLGLCLWVPPWPLWLVACGAAVWLIRTLYFHAGLTGALADFALNGFAVLAALGAAAQTGSVFWSLWSGFLVQALFAFIPSTAAIAPPHTDADAFQQAQRAAEAALRRLSAPH